MEKDSSIIDLLLIGNSIDKIYLTSLTNEAEQLIQRKIRFLILNEAKKEELLANNTSLFIWHS